MNTLPEEIENYILWLAVGAMDLDIYNKKKAINKEFKFFKELRKESPGPEGGVYLYSLDCYDKTPELECIEYKFGSRYLEPDYGMTKENHTRWVLENKERWIRTGSWISSYAYE
jgi:hypothetical protein